MGRQRWIGLLLGDAGGVDSLQQTGKEREMFETLVVDRVAAVDTSVEGDAYIRAITDAVSRLSSSGGSYLVVSMSGQDYVAHELKL